MATKYVSSLTGEEMDAALIDMAYHNSEAYAVGTRNGIPVGSSDVTYHNNSKYWAEQGYGYTDRAEDAANRAEAAVPSGTAGAVFFDRAQTLTSAQQAQARANIAAGGSNRNLLDNPWFIINQRGATSGGNGTYPADRWGVSYGTVGVQWSRNADGSIAVTPNNLTSHGDLTQEIDSDVFPFLANKTVTASVMLANGEIYSGSTVVSTSTTKTPIYVEIDDKILQVNIYAAGRFAIQSWRGTLSIKAAKLELGSVSTLANDVPPELSIARIPCYENHLRLKGQYAPVGYAIALSTTLALLAIPTPVPMRIAPTPSLSGTLYFNAGTPFAITSVQNPTLGVNQVMIQVVGTFDTGKVYLAQFRDATSYLDLSADL